jgi:hypothetical protein
VNTAIQPVQTMPATETEVTLKATIGELIEASKKVVIVSQVDLSIATDLCKAIKQRLKEADDARTAITQPINKGLSEVNSRFKAMTTPLADAETSLKNKMVQFQDAAERRAKEEAARLQKIQDEKDRVAEEERQARAKEEAAQGEDPDLDRPVVPVSISPPPAPIVSAPIQPQIRKTTYGQSGAAFTAKKVWDYELVDLSKVPVQFLCLDTTKVGQAVKAGIREIPGIKVFEKTVAQVK